MLSRCRVLLPASPFSGDNLIVIASPCWQANLVGRSRALESRPKALFRSVRSADPDWDTSATHCFLFFMGLKPNGQRARAGGTGPQDGGWEMTDGPMEWCQAGWGDSWNRLPICDCPKKDGPVRRLSYHLHYQEEQLPAAMGEEHHAMYRAGVEIQTWTTNELNGQWSGNPWSGWLPWKVFTIRGLGHNRNNVFLQSAVVTVFIFQDEESPQFNPHGCCFARYSVYFGVNITTCLGSSLPSIHSGKKARWKSKGFLRAGSSPWTLVIVVTQPTCCYKKFLRCALKIAWLIVDSAESQQTHSKCVCCFQCSRHLGRKWQTRQLSFKEWGLIRNCFWTVGTKRSLPTEMSGPT